jgi:hypothetical protein
MIEQLLREPRVKFKQPLRIVPLTSASGPPQAFQGAALDLSKQGIFVEMKDPFAPGTRVAISLEAGGRVLPFAEAEVTWNRTWPDDSGFGAKFVSFMHPQSKPLVKYLVENLSKGRPLLAAKSAAADALSWKYFGAALGFLALVVCLAFGLWPSAKADFAQPLASESTAQRNAEALPGPQMNKEVTALFGTMEKIPADDVLAPLGQNKPEPKFVNRELKFSSGAVKGLILRAHGNNFELVPNGKVKLVKAFELKNPPRLVMDFAGSKPIKSQLVALKGTRLRQVRVGKTNGGTRLIFDFNSEPMNLKTSGNSVLFSFTP